MVAEAYAERNYAYDPRKKQLTLASRSKEYASITDCDAAIEHATRIIKEGQVSAYLDDTTRIDVPIKVETICIHSDSKIALDLAKRLAKQLNS